MQISNTFCINSAINQIISSTPFYNDAVRLRLIRQIGQDLLMAADQQLVEEIIAYTNKATNAIISCNNKDLLIVLHTLKGNTLTFGFELAGACFTVLEKYAIENPLPLSEDMLKSLILIKEKVVEKAAIN